MPQSPETLMRQLANAVRMEAWSRDKSYVAGIAHYQDEQRRTLAALEALGYDADTCLATVTE